MNLAQGDQRPRLLAIGGAELPQESLSIAFDRAAGILLGEAEVETAPTISARKPVDSSAESVNQPRNATKGFRTKDGQARLIGVLSWHQNILTIGLVIKGKMRPCCGSALGVPVWRVSSPSRVALSLNQSRTPFVPIGGLLVGMRKL